MDKFLDTNEIFKHTSLKPPRQALKVVASDGNVENWTIEDLRDLGLAVSVAKSEYLDAGDYAVYVMGGYKGLAVKVGRAKSPSKRLAELQTGRADTLFLHRVFWFRLQEHAVEIERIAHQWIGRTHSRLRGEWFNCGPARAHKAIEQAVDWKRFDCAIFTPGINMGEDHHAN